MERLSLLENNTVNVDLGSINIPIEETLQVIMRDAEQVLRREVHLHGFPFNNGDLKEFCRGERLLANVYVNPTACSGIDIQPPSIHDFLLIDIDK